MNDTITNVASDNTQKEFSLSEMMHIQENAGVITSDDVVKVEKVLNEIIASHTTHTGTDAKPKTKTVNRYVDKTWNQICDAYGAHTDEQKTDLLKWMLETNATYFKNNQAYKFASFQNDDN